MKQTKHPHAGLMRRYVLAAVVLIVSLLSATNAAAQNYLSFSSESDFKLEAYKGWNGTLYYSTDLKTWTEWNGSQISSDNGKLYLRGTGNTKITGSDYSGEYRWILSGSDIACTGNIENLLDYETVAKGEHPTMARHCYSSMFFGCTSLTAAPALPATTLADYCYYFMFNGCASLTTPPALPATTLKDCCYQYMFYGCTSLTTAPELPATTLADYCYYGMFRGCTSLTTAPALPATTLASSCYSSMFEGCTSLTTAPALPATTLASSCYSSMFSGCTGITTAPELPATFLANSCYGSMFSGCAKLTNAPTLPATTFLSSYCYSSMFSDCTSLTTAPALPATTLADDCYKFMFYGCTSLTAAPELPATTLADYCYYGMFYGCTSLTTPPALPATTLASSCYVYMFSGCTSLKVSEEKTDEYAKPWRIPSVGEITEEATDWNYSMLYNTGGTFTDDPSINTTYYLYGTETGIDNAEAQPAALRLYPNPASRHVSVSGLPAGGGTVQIFDVAGRLVLSVESSGHETRTIDISGLAPGLHYVRSGSQTAKLMVK